MMDHSINVYKDAITPELCDELISLIGKEMNNTEKEVIGDYQNVECYNLDLDDYEEYDEKVFTVVDEIIDRVIDDHEWFPDELIYGGFVVREHWGRTALHVDGPFDDKDSTDTRILSMIIALNDDYDGGVFDFPAQSYQVRLKKGEAITFPPSHFYPHEVSRPSNGKRYTICLWVLTNPELENDD